MKNDIQAPCALTKIAIIRSLLTVFVARSQMLRVVLFGLMLLTLSEHSGKAQIISFAAKDRYEEIPVTTQGENTTFTVMQHADNQFQWYYVPDKPRLTRVIVNGKDEPELSLIKVRYEDPANPGIAKEVGVLQFAFTLAIPSDVNDKLRAEIAKRRGIDAKLVRLSALPMKDAVVAVYNPNTKELTSTINGAGLGPSFATQKIAIQMTLDTQVANDYYNALLTEANTGVPVAVSWKYGGLTEPAGFTVHVDYGKLFDHYSSQESFRAEASWWGLWGASYERTASEVRERLSSAGAMTVEIHPGSGLSLADMDKYLQPILARINAKVIETFAPPDRIVPAEVKRSDKGGFFGSANYARSTKMVSQRVDYKEDIDWRVRNYEERQTIASGYMNLAATPKELRDKLVFTAKAPARYDAYFSLPDIVGVDGATVQMVSYEINISGTPTSGDPLAFKWTPNEKWTNLAGQSKKTGFVPLSSLGVNGTNIGNVEYRIVTKVAANGSEYPFERKIKASENLNVIPLPTRMFQTVKFYPDALVWKQPTDTKGLLSVSVTINHNGKSYGATIRPPQVGQSLSPTTILLPLVDGQPQGQVTATLVFKFSGNKNVNWSENGKNLRDVDPNLEFNLEAPPSP